MKYLIIQLKHGWANRINDIIMGVIYCKLTNRILVIDNKKDISYGENSFSKCFDLKNVDYIFYSSDIPSNSVKIKDLTNLNYNEQVLLFDTTMDTYTTAALLKIYYGTEFILNNITASFYNFFNINDQLIMSAKEFNDSLNLNNLLGWHIRYGNPLTFKKLYNKDYVSNYIFIKNYIKQYNLNSIFICYDNKYIFNITNFPSINKISMNKTLFSNQYIDVEDNMDGSLNKFVLGWESLLEALCLSFCNTILLQSSSGFSVILVNSFINYLYKTGVIKQVPLMLNPSSNLDYLKLSN